MADNASDEPRGRRPTGRRTGRPGRPGGGRKGGPNRRGRPGASGPIRLAPIGDNRFELVHPACVHETELDYEEGLEIWKAGDPEGARDALRYALGACGANMWIHVALGRIALEEFRDPSLARGHFAYAVELGRRALSPQFAGLLPADRPRNRPLFDAIDGLIRTLDALGKGGDAASLRTLKNRLSGGRSEDDHGPSNKPDSAV
jgi:hypothetical protein